MSVHTRHARARVLATSSALVLSIALAQAPARAQQDEGAQEQQQERIVVTGSRIQRQDFESNSPIVTIDESTFQNTGTIGLETILNQLPQFIPAAFTQFNTQAVEPNPYATPGTSNVSLRGLGANRNLVLVDGRRVVPINASNAVDTNSIPTSAVQRTEIISGGASAVYGADAVAGAVNIILKDNFEGFEVNTRYSTSELGDANEFLLSFLFGAGSADGRGNVMFAGEHSSRGDAAAIERDWYVEQLENPSTVGFGTGQEFWFSDTFYQGNAWPGTNFPGEVSPSQAAVDSIFNQAAPGTVHNTSSFFINRSPDVNTATLYTGGNLFAITTVPGIDPFGPFFGNEPDGGYRYAGPTLQSDYPNGPLWRKQMPNGEWVENQLANFLSTPLDRYSLFGRGKYDLTDSITATFDARFAQTESRTLLQYSPAANGWGAEIPYGTEIYAPSVDANGNTLAAYQAGGAFGLACPPVGGCTETQAFPVPPELAVLLNSRVVMVQTAGQGTPDDPSDDVFTAVSHANDSWHMSRNLDFLPRRQTNNRSTNYQLTAGLKGELPNDLYWDATISHGQADGLIQSIGFASLDAYRAIVTSPNYGRSFFQFENPGHGTFAAGVGSCTSGLPIVEDFQVSEDCIKALSVDMQETTFMKQNLFQANLNGDLFDLPAGTVGFNIGTEYREQEFEFRTDPQKSIDKFTDQAIGIFPAGSTKGDQSVSEVYAELLVPVVKDLPALKQFNLELGGRYSDYNDVGGVETYKALADWLILDWVRFRGGYNRANRAPNIGELYQARTTQAFAPAGVAAVNGDPCNPNNLLSPVSVNPLANQGGAAGAQHALETCVALMGNLASAQAFYAAPAPAGANGAAGLTGQTIFVGNPDLDPETADTWTAGLVITAPTEAPWGRGLQLSVDYYDISIEDLIGQKPVDSLYLECLSAQVNPTGDITTPSCAAIRRSDINGAAQEVEVPYTNEASIELAGVDIQLNYTAQFADLGLAAVPGGLNLNVLATVPSTVKFRASDAVPWQSDYIGTQAMPPQTTGAYYDYTVFTTLNYFAGPWTASVRWNFYPDIKPAACQTAPTTCNESLGIPKKYDIFNLSGSYQLNDSVLLRAGIDNLLDTEPPLGGGNPTNAAFPIPASRSAIGGVYDPIGRRYFVGLTATF